MTDSELKQQELAANYQAGKAAFERGQYRQAVEHLTKARSLAGPNSRLGGEIQLWLVTAYEAAGSQTEAIALCRSLRQHPDTQTRKQSRRLLYILEAPKLNLRPEWLTQIPDLSQVAESDPKDRRGSSLATKPRPTPKAPDSTPVDLTQVNTQDNQFVWLAMGVLSLILGTLVWIS